MIATRLTVVGLALLLSACATTSGELSQRAPKYERGIAKPPGAVKECIVSDAPELYTVVEKDGGYRIINAGSLGAVFVIDIMPSPFGSSVKAYAPGLFWRSRIDRCS